MREDRAAYAINFREQRAKAWLVSDYVLMPDHLHLFCAPGERVVEIKRWISFWKDHFSKTHADVGTFQRGGVHQVESTQEPGWTQGGSEPGLAAPLSVPPVSQDIEDNPKTKERGEDVPEGSERQPQKRLITEREEQ